MLDLTLPIEARPGPMVLANEDLRRRNDMLDMLAFQLQSNIHTQNARTAGLKAALQLERLENENLQVELQARDENRRRNQPSSSATYSHFLN